MQWLGYSDKDDPDALPTEPEKKGVALFWQIIKEHFFSLILLNILFVLFCIPVVTIGPAFKALDRVTMRLVRNLATNPIRDFLQDFKDDFVSTMVIGLATMALVALTIAGFFLIPSHKPSEFSVIVSFVIVLYILAVAMYVFKITATIILPKRTTVKNAFLLTFVSFKELALMFLLTILPSFLIANIIYFNVPVFFLLIFSYNSLVTSMISWDVIQKHLVIDK